MGKLLTKNPKKRLGFNGVEEIKKHGWFNNINWSDIENKNFIPIYEPDIENNLEYFDGKN